MLDSCGDSLTKHLPEIAVLVGELLMGKQKILAANSFLELGWIVIKFFFDLARGIKKGGTNGRIEPTKPDA